MKKELRLLSDDDNELFKETDDKIAIIRILVIVTLVMEYLRRLEDVDKERLDRYCRKVMQRELVLIILQESQGTLDEQALDDKE